MNPLKEKEKWGIKFITRLLQGIGVFAGVFTLILCTLLITNYFQLKRTVPLDNPTLQKLVNRLDESPQDQELRDEIRALDLLARRAYFTRRWQIRTGSYMLLVSVLVFGICLKALTMLQRKLPEHGGMRWSKSPWAASVLSRKVIIAGGSALLIAALAVAFLSNSALRDEYLAGYREGISAETPEEGPELEAVTPDEQEIKENYLDTEELKRNWTSFRGPGGNGIALSEDAPVFWNGTTGEGILWKAAVPKPGFNSPIVWDNLLFISGADRESREVYCFDRNTGEMLWQRPIDDMRDSREEPPEVSEDTGYAASTMATDGTYVFAIFPTGDIVGLDLEGILVWARNLGMPENHYGHSSSLMTYRNLLIVQYDHEAGASLMALEAGTGETVWETQRDVMTSWSSPIVVYTGRRPEIILNATPYVASYDPETGRELWSVECMMGEVGPSPAYAGGTVFAVNQYALLAAIDIRTRQIVWEAYDDLPDAASPVAAGGYLFLPTRYGIVSCLDAKSGEVYWTQDLGEGSYSSPIYAGDRIYLMDKSGVMHIFKADREYVSMGDPELGEESWATPAFIENRIYIRGHSHLFCIGVQDE